LLFKKDEREERKKKGLPKKKKWSSLFVSNEDSFGFLSNFNYVMINVFLISFRTADDEAELDNLLHHSGLIIDSFY
jgi:hypothetical protein